MQELVELALSTIHQAACAVFLSGEDRAQEFGEVDELVGVWEQQHRPVFLLSMVVHGVVNQRRPSPVWSSWTCRYVLHGFYAAVGEGLDYGVSELGKSSLVDFFVDVALQKLAVRVRNVPWH